MTSHRISPDDIQIMTGQFANEALYNVQMMTIGSRWGGVAGSSDHSKWKYSCTRSRDEIIAYIPPHRPLSVGHPIPYTNMAKRTSKKKKNAKQHARSVSVTSDKRKDLSETDATDGNNLHEEPKPVEEEPQNPDEVEEAKGKCQHLKAVKIKKLKQALPQVKKDLNCKMCAKQPSSAKPSASAADVAGDGSSATSPAWICLTCAQLHCGRAVNKHALQHYEEMGMDHALAVNVDTFECWCYACDSEVVASSTRNQLVQEALTAIEKAIKPKYAGKMKGTFRIAFLTITSPHHPPLKPLRPSLL
ncbi:Zn-finger in ubiquitin-hydrolases and other protein-domain-containing protein [Jimgerdemannia flammicorona]|uniref:Zn-finger in ubiquitin-hydrolases and other protein-domain-containing protein n=1 Tax=Jimgerdemannia flammicorona TaxID=994334 RepID=A0A433DKE2_9FUNG|nr:Zn-finger in ubiquitin-hydrolases and other protein-domain-containing protein [Jimgerdemannia flammicorona]